MSLAGFVIAAALWVSGLNAQDYEMAESCEEEIGRQCTTFEEHEFCLHVAIESNLECDDAADGWLDRRICDLTWAIDFMASLGTGGLLHSW